MSSRVSRSSYAQSQYSRSSFSSRSLNSRGSHSVGSRSIGSRRLNSAGEDYDCDTYDGGGGSVYEGQSVARTIEEEDPEYMEDPTAIDDGEGEGEGDNDSKVLPAEMSMYDLFFDLPHPAASPSCPRARIIDSPVAADNVVMDELFDPSNISRVARFAFPEHDDELHAAEVAAYANEAEGQSGTGDAASSLGDASVSASAVPSSANLNRFDIYLKSFYPQHHTFALQLTDGRRVHGHVRRYLPTHLHARTRADVGRRGARAMVLLTRATGGEHFYAAVLKTVEAIYMESDGVPAELQPDEIPSRTFLHALHNYHARLLTEYSTLHVMGGNLNFRPTGHGMMEQGAEGESPAETARAFMAQNENLFRVQISGVEFGGYSGVEDLDPTTGALGRRVVSGDSLRFRLPPSLQPGYGATSTSNVEDMHSPIVPLLRCLGSPHTLRLLSALLCETRVVLISKSASRLSTCVRACTAMLAQGLLIWRHIQVPVLPPHLLKYLASDTPYLIGLLEQHAANIEVLPCMNSVLCVNLDWNELRTYNMPDQASTIPDLLKAIRRSMTADHVFSPAEVLAKDMAELLKNDRAMWGGMTGGKTGGGGAGGDAATGGGQQPDGDGSNHGGEKAQGESKKGVKTTILSLFNKKKRKDNSSPTGPSGGPMQGGSGAPEGQRRPSMPGQNEGGEASADMAAFMGSVMRKGRNPMLSTLGSKGGDIDDMSSVGDDFSSQGDDFPTNTRALEEARLAGWTIEAEATCENERAEEEMRAALASFYLYVFGDMGMYLSEAEDGSLWLDRKKFLLRKKQMGDRESSPMFAVCLHLSRSLMFESFVRGRIADLEMSVAERAKMMPHHIPLFVYCEKYLRINRLKFTQANIRRVVSATVLSCPQHLMVDETESIRARALELTSNEPYKGNVVVAVESLVTDCREVNGVLPQVMAVIWARIVETRSAYWRHPLLALHLLKNLILHGPLAAISEAIDGIDKVRALKAFSSKNAASAHEVQIVAKQVFALLTDRSQLFFKRRRAGIERTYHTKAHIEALRWNDYLIRRLPITSGFNNIHVLMRPCDIVMKEPPITEETPEPEYVESYEEVQDGDGVTPLHDAALDGDYIDKQYVEGYDDNGYNDEEQYAQQQYADKAAADGGHDGQQQYAAGYDDYGDNDEYVEGYNGKQQYDGEQQYVGAAAADEEYDDQEQYEGHDGQQQYAQDYDDQLHAQGYVDDEMYEDIPDLGVSNHHISPHNDEELHDAGGQHQYQNAEDELSEATEEQSADMRRMLSFYNSTMEAGVDNAKHDYHEATGQPEPHTVSRCESKDSVGFQSLENVYEKIDGAESGEGGEDEYSQGSPPLEETMQRDGEELYDQEAADEDVTTLSSALSQQGEESDQVIDDQLGNARAVVENIESSNGSVLDDRSPYLGATDEVVAAYSRALSQHEEEQNKDLDDKVCKKEGPYPDDHSNEESMLPEGNVMDDEGEDDNAAIIDDHTSKDAATHHSALSQQEQESDQVLSNQGDNAGALVEYFNSPQRSREGSMPLEGSAVDDKVQEDNVSKQSGQTLYLEATNIEIAAHSSATFQQEGESDQDIMYDQRAGALVVHENNGPQNFSDGSMSQNDNVMDYQVRENSGAVVEYVNDNHTSRNPQISCVENMSEEGRTMDDEVEESNDMLGCRTPRTDSSAGAVEAEDQSCDDSGGEHKLEQWKVVDSHRNSGSTAARKHLSSKLVDDRSDEDLLKTLEKVDDSRLDPGTSAMTKDVLPEPGDEISDEDLLKALENNRIQISQG